MPHCSNFAYAYRITGTAELRPKIQKSERISEMVILFCTGGDNRIDNNHKRFLTVQQSCSQYSVIQVPVQVPVLEPQVPVPVQVLENGT